MARIELKNVSKIIHKQPVIEDVTMLMESRHIYGFQGVNGSGKTMLMRLLCGLIRPTCGSIEIDGKCLGRDITFPESLGLFLENAAFLDGYSGFENLKMLAGLQGQICDEEIRCVLDAVGLSDAAEKKYRKYSLGMKQRLGIGAAIMEKPDIVVLDEPTNALDAEGIARVKEILTSEKGRGALVVISCHDGVILQELADEIFVLESGRLKAHLHSSDFSDFAQGRRELKQ
ncbi:ATP-binding cassette domain-containing protein [Emergencia sp. 1XD21-10]|uniref:ATP-binding cassette domain-containing protein n=1 Tax=Emergencia sp. 1XD21-10 TaxID=2304569 RepID=UPI00137A322B|nr:ATP-binding cassette domain-containing protein [Emergencia sp. 1XD21-10]NCE98233.1 ATP-binding cassette domain-containing protein [Emergencia sp. 1XD21-10]